MSLHSTTSAARPYLCYYNIARPCQFHTYRNATYQLRYGCTYTPALTLALTRPPTISSPGFLRFKPSPLTGRVSATHSRTLSYSVPYVSHIQDTIVTWFYVAFYNVFNPKKYPKNTLKYCKVDTPRDKHLNQNRGTSKNETDISDLPRLWWLCVRVTIAESNIIYHEWFDL